MYKKDYAPNQEDFDALDKEMFNKYEEKPRLPKWIIPVGIVFAVVTIGEIIWLVQLLNR